jgi:CBS domain-containing protein
MATPVVSFTPGADVCEVVERMLQGRAGWVPIVDGHTVVGVITPADLFGVTPAEAATP